MLRLILSIVGGLVLAFAGVFVTDALFHALSPSAAAMPETGDKEAMRAYVANLPASLLAAMLMGWTIAALAGSFVAARFGGRGEWPGRVVGGLFLLATAANFLMVAHPTWMVITAFALIIAAAAIGAKAGARAPRKPPQKQASA